MTVSEARAALPSVVDRVQAGDEITITRHGVPVAVVVRPDTLRTRRAERAMTLAASIDDLLAQGRRTALADAPGLSAERAETLLADVRASRSHRR